VATRVYPSACSIEASTVPNDNPATASKPGSANNEATGTATATGSDAALGSSPR
jgi:hypothetical protein